MYTFLLRTLNKDLMRVFPSCLGLAWCLLGVGMVTVPSRPKSKYVFKNTRFDMKARLDELAFFERMALEESSQANMASVVRCYIQCCESLGLRPFPVSFRTLGLYFVQYCHRFGHTTRSVPGIISHLKRANRSRGGAWLSEGDKARLDDVIAGLKKYDRTATARKLPMTHDVLDAVQAVADMTVLQQYQHITMARVAHDALLRGVELIKLRVADLQWAQDGKSVTLLIHLSKANKVGPVERVTISDFGDTSAVAYLREYIRLMGFPSGSACPLWPVISPAGVIHRSKATPKRVFVAKARQLLAKAGFSAKDYSGHSYRSGGATDLWRSHRCRPLTIKLHGRWKSDAYRLYIRDNPQDTAAEVAAALSFFAKA